MYKKMAGSLLDDDKNLHTACPFVTHNNNKLLSSCVIYFTYFTFSNSFSLLYRTCTNGDNATIYGS